MFGTSACEPSPDRDSHPDKSATREETPFIYLLTYLFLSLPLLLLLLALMLLLFFLFFFIREATHELNIHT